MVAVAGAELDRGRGVAAVDQREMDPRAAAEPRGADAARGERAQLHIDVRGDRQRHAQTGDMTRIARRAHGDDGFMLPGGDGRRQRRRQGKGDGLPFARLEMDAGREVRAPAFVDPAFQRDFKQTGPVAVIQQIDGERRRLAGDDRHPGGGQPGDHGAVHGIMPRRRHDRCRGGGVIRGAIDHGGFPVDLDHRRGAGRHHLPVSQRRGDRVQLIVGRGAIGVVVGVVAIGLCRIVGVPGVILHGRYPTQDATDVSSRRRRPGQLWSTSRRAKTKAPDLAAWGFHL